MSDYADILNGKLSSGDAANLVEKLQSDLAASRAEVEKLKEALQEIRDKKGKVCAEYETCEHPACASSYESWALAHRVLDLTPPHPSVLAGSAARQMSRNAFMQGNDPDCGCRSIARFRMGSACGTAWNRMRVD